MDDGFLLLGLPIRKPQVEDVIQKVLNSLAVDDRFRFSAFLLPFLEIAVQLFDSRDRGV